MVRISPILCLKSVRSLWRPIHLETMVKPSNPGLKSPYKLWWAKEITPDLHVSGWLTNRQMKYAAEGGFKSVVCLNFDENGTYAGDKLPGPSEAKSTASLSNLNASFINFPDTPNLESAKELSNVISTLEKPILVTGKTQKNATLLALLGLAYQSRISSKDSPKVRSKAIFNLGDMMGYDFTDEQTKNLIAELTEEESALTQPPRPDVESSSILDYWPAQRIAKDWYTAGQIRRQELPVLERAGFKSIINMRMGVEYRGKPSQEPVTLLNIHDSLATYDESGRPTRRNADVMKVNRVFPDAPVGYISEGSDVNYESLNEEEFGDDVGYNESIEKEFMKSYPGINYSHTPFPLPNVEYTIDMFEEFKEELVTADKHGPVLLHCRIGKRVGYLGILAYAIKEGRSLQWAEKRAMEMGHEVSATVKPDIYKIYKEYLHSE